jgi:hypothetical protein
MDIENTIKEVKQNLSATTLKKYVGFVKKLNKLVTNEDEVKDTNFLNDYDKVNNVLKTINPPNRKNYYSVILILLNDKKDTDLYEKYNKDKMENNLFLKNKKEDINVVNSQTQQDKVISIEEYDKLIDLTGKDPKYRMDNLIFNILRYYPIRNEIGSFKMITLEMFNKHIKNNIELKDNFIVIGKRKIIMFRTKYKTANKYGNLENEIKEKDLKKSIRDYIYDFNKGEGDYLFLNNNDEAYSNDALSLRLANTSNKAIGVKLSTSSIFKILLANKKGSTKEITDYIVKMSRIRPTNAETVMQNYVYEKNN